MAAERNLRRTPEELGRDAPDGDVISHPGKTPGPGGTNPFSHEGDGATGGTGGVNPSGTTAGTEAWGLAEGESKTTGTGQGQLGKEPSIDAKTGIKKAKAEDRDIKGRQPTNTSPGPEGAHLEQEED